MGTTAIEWATDSWNPVRGCSKKSSGCRNCYAVRQAMRQAKPGQRYHGLVRNGQWTGKVVLHEDTLNEPYSWGKSRTVFVPSMSDLFHEELSDTDILRVFEVMNNTPDHRYIVFTKRPERLLELDDRITWTENIAMGVSVEDTDALYRVELLRKCGAFIKAVSAEPLLEPLPSSVLDELDWIIVGGESGPGARPMDLDWARQIRDECQRRGVAFFFKQEGAVVGKGAKTLDGVTHHDSPKRWADPQPSTLNLPQARAERIRELIHQIRTTLNELAALVGVSDETRVKDPKMVAAGHKAWKTRRRNERLRKAS